MILGVSEMRHLFKLPCMSIIDDSVQVGICRRKVKSSEHDVGKEEEEEVVEEMEKG